MPGECHCTRLPSVCDKQLLACHRQATTSRPTSALLRFSFRIWCFLWSLLAGCKMLLLVIFLQRQLCRVAPPNWCTSLGSYQGCTRSAPECSSNSVKYQLKILQNLRIFESSFFTIFPFVYCQALKCILLNGFSFIKNQQQQQQQQNLPESNTG